MPPKRDWKAQADAAKKAWEQQHLLQKPQVKMMPKRTQPENPPLDCPGFCLDPHSYTHCKKVCSAKGISDCERKCFTLSQKRKFKLGEHGNCIKCIHMRFNAAKDLFKTHIIERINAFRADPEAYEPDYDMYHTRYSELKSAADMLRYVKEGYLKLFQTYEASTQYTDQQKASRVMKLVTAIQKELEEIEAGSVCDVKLLEESYGYDTHKIKFPGCLSIRNWKSHLDNWLAAGGENFESGAYDAAARRRI